MFVVVDVPAATVSIQQTLSAVSYFCCSRLFVGYYPDHNQSDPKKEESKEPICSGVNNDGDDGCNHGYEASEAEYRIYGFLHSGTHFRGRGARPTPALPRHNFLNFRPQLCVG